MRSIRQLDREKKDLRVWCFRCARGECVDSIIWQVFKQRGWDDALPGATARFRCSCCRQVDQVLVTAATRPQRDPVTAVDVVATYFHMMRSAAKKRRRK